MSRMRPASLSMLVKRHGRLEVLRSRGDPFSLGTAWKHSAEMLILTNGSRGGGILAGRPHPMACQPPAQSPRSDRPRASSWPFRLLAWPLTCRPRRDSLSARGIRPTVQRAGPAETALRQRQRRVSNRVFTDHRAVHRQQLSGEIVRVRLLRSLGKCSAR